MKIKPLLFLIIGAALGWFASLWVHPGRSEGEKAGIAPVGGVLFYQSPMHPWIKSDRPGKCTVCGMDLVPIFQGQKPFESGGPVSVVLPRGTPNVVGVTTCLVKKAPFTRTLHVAGTIGEDESRHGVISSPVEGRFDGLAMSCEGQMVNRRQPLGTLFSQTLLAEADLYKKALGQGSAGEDEARRRLERHGLVWEQIKAIPLRQPDDIYFGILAPLSGVILKTYVAEGQYVKEGEKLFETADFTTMWFQFTVYEQDVPLVRKGQNVTLTIPSMPGKVVKGRVSFINPSFDEATRSAHVRVVVENPDATIKNRTFAEADLAFIDPEVLNVPRSALLWPGGDPRVYVEKQDGIYEQRAVKIGRAGDAGWEIIEGLREGEKVVVTGNMLLDGQAQMASSVENTPSMAKSR